MLGAHQTATATRVLDKLEDLSDRAADALANEIAEEKERLKRAHPLMLACAGG